jgi:hypothetical protein
MSGHCLYLSGNLDTVAETLETLLHLFPRLAPDACVVGSSGGALLAAFLTQGRCAGQRRRFEALAARLQRSWPEALDAARAWVRDATGGAACSMRQWTSRHAPFRALLYDYQRMRPVVVGESSALPVAFVLASAVLREDPSRAFPATPWVDVEDVLSDTLLARCLRPPVALHFAGPQEPPDTQSLTSLIGRASSVSAPPAHLTWSTSLASPRRDTSNALASLLCTRWSGFLTPQRERASAPQLASQLALALCAWTLALLRTPPR